FVAPWVNPATIHRLAAAKSTMVGTRVSTAAADIGPHSILKLEMKLFRAVGIVRFSSVLISVTDRNSSFQLLTKLKMYVATMPGVITGTMTRHSALNREQPSIMAASSRLSGTLSKKPRSMMTANGMVMAMYTRTSPYLRSTSPRLVNIWYSGPRAMKAGIICVTRNANMMGP